MTNNAIEFAAVSKRYQLGVSTTIREALVARAKSALHRQSAPSQFWSLRDVSFSVKSGSAVGLIGRNGAGKSTILKIIAGITTPTQGEARTRGRVAALLEIGTGFHPELTGRENIYLNGTILGMTRADIRRRFSDIVEFAGMETFLDTPAKRYSSGMSLRLAFAVAAHLEPDILVVDEILAVGDAEFQRRCLTRLEDVGKEGRTVVFVSHDLGAIQRLCPTALWLDRGEVRASGPASNIVSDYLADTDLTSAEKSIKAGPLIVDNVRVTTETGPSATVTVGDRISFSVDIEVKEPRNDIDVAVYLTNRAGLRLVDEVLSEKSDQKLRPGKNTLRMTLPGLFNSGWYAIGVWAGTAQTEYLDVPAIASFTVVGGDSKRPERMLVLETSFDLS